MSGYTVRTLTEVDWPSVRTIYQQGIESNIATFQNECPTWREWDATHIKDCRLVIGKNETVLGWAALTAVSSRCVYAGVAEVSVYIDVGAQGRGVGTRLLTELVHASESAGFWMLQSGILRENAASIRLHEKCGFRMVGFRERIGRDRFGIWRDTVLMERRSMLARYGQKVSVAQEDRNNPKEDM